ncbi:MAG: glutathione peroxidase [Marinilabiliaceae bacterium]|jgi:glutathione peroxidase|nr:glutathione peroxidase [Marinilabiliaceae bacterium]
MKRFFSILTALTFFIGLAAAQSNSFYDFKVKTLEGNEFDFEELKGMKVMLVNTASKCGLTPQYEELQELYEKYGGDDFIIIGFPANNFRSQEPGSDAEIRTFCSENYGVTFPMMSKISVKGDDIHPLYKWLTTKTLNGVEDSEVSWNFQKYLIDENGKLVKHLKPTKKPLSKEVLEWLDS